MIDSYKRNINYLRISVTDLCNLRCRYCMPECGVEKTDCDQILRIEEIEKIAKAFIELGVDKIRITGGEPLVRKGIMDLIERLGCLDGLKDFSMTTNGLLLKGHAKKLKELGLDRINISLDTLDSQKYEKITRGGKLSSVLDGIDEARAAGLTPIKINTVLIGGFNEDEIEDLAGLTAGEETDVRFIELMPIGEARNWSLERFIPNSRILQKCRGLSHVKSFDKSSPASYYRLPQARGRVGLINPVSCKFCDNCNRIRLTCDGKLKLCLHSNEEIDIRTPLRKGMDIKKIIEEAIMKKPKSHRLEDGQYIDKNMVSIGG